MEELQLTLTPSRVDQRNFGIMLANWRVGQTISALVSDRAPDGKLILSLGGQSFVTPRDIPVQPGQKVMLEVKQIEPSLVLRIINQPPIGGLSSGNNSEVEGSLLRGAAQGFSGIASLVAALAVGSKSLGASNIAEGTQLTKLLGSNMLSATSLSAEQIKSVFILSGIFTEALWAANRPLLAARSIKTIFLTFRDRALAALASPNISAAERSALTRLIGEIDTALGVITKQQLASTPADTGVAKWNAALPLSLGDHIAEIDVDLCRRPCSEPDDGYEWSVTLQFELEAAGAVKIFIELVNQRIRAEFTLVEEMLGCFDRSSLELDSMLRAVGFEQIQLSAIAAESDNAETGLSSHKSEIDISV